MLSKLFKPMVVNETNEGRFRLVTYVLDLV